MYSLLMDTNVFNYTIDELHAIIETDDPTDEAEIKDKTDHFIRKFEVTNPLLSIFFEQVQKRLKYNSENNNNEEDIEPEHVIENYQNMTTGQNNMNHSHQDQAQNWYQNQYLYRVR